jgi:hypothetical protein
MLGADEKDVSTARSNIEKELASLMPMLQGEVEIEDMNSISLTIDVREHLWIPAMGLVAKVGPSIKQRFNRYRDNGRCGGLRVSHFFLMS